MFSGRTVGEAMKLFINLKKKEQAQLMNAHNNPNRVFSIKFFGHSFKYKAAQLCDIRYKSNEFKKTDVPAQVYY